MFNDIYEITYCFLVFLFDVYTCILLRKLTILNCSIQIFVSIVRYEYSLIPALNVFFYLVNYFSKVLNQSDKTHTGAHVINISYYNLHNNNVTIIIKKRLQGSADKSTPRVGIKNYVDALQ